MMRICLILPLLLFTLPLSAGVRAQLRQSGKLYEQKKYGQALAQYNDVLQKNPNNEQASFGAGASAYYLKDYKTAQNAFEQTAEQDGIRSQDALFNLGNTYYRAGQKDKAIATYRQAILKNPKDKEAIHNLQLILQEKNNQNNQNNQNDQNQQNNSSNQQQGDKDNQAGSSGDDQQQPQQKQPDPQQADKDAAQRVMQMARENEQKPNQQGGVAQTNFVEKDW